MGPLPRFSEGRFWVLEPDEGKLSSPVLRGLGASNGARLLDQVHCGPKTICPVSANLRVEIELD
jgi:hypothetical protein